ncbi:MAG TPA: hypothetical protein VN924_18130 [Bryobacteraceae bacterium]|nr:hypothetical protein [Bryobacteraceae bacterium]
MNGIGSGVVLLSLFGMFSVCLRAGTVTTTCYDRTEYQQDSGSESAACSVDGQWGIVAGSGGVSADGLSVATSADSLYSDPYATASASLDMVFPTAETLTWQIGWSYGADYSMSLDMAGQYAPLYQWVSENLSGADWSQTVGPGDYTFTADSQDYGEGDATLSATLIAETAVGDPPDPVPEPVTWVLAGWVLAGSGLVAVGRRPAVKIR